MPFLRFRQSIPPSLFASAAVLLLVACGGGGTDPGGNGNGTSSTPASVAISSGNNQEALPGTTVPVAPAVVVRNAQGQAVSGVAVQFAVAEGGGSVAGGTPSTDASGIARVTSWTLGSSGTQRLTATVAGLSPVSFMATIAATPNPTLTFTQGPNGGAIEITTPGHPLRGFTITVPPGTFASSGTWEMRIATSPTPPTLPAGYRAIGPVLEIETSQGRGADLMTLDLPVTVAPNRGVVVALRDPVRGVMEVLQTVAQTATTIRVVTAHLRSDLLLGAVSPTVKPLVRDWRLAQGAFSANTAQVWFLEYDYPQPPVPPILNPLIHKWPVLDKGTYLSPEGNAFAIAALQTMAHARPNTVLGTLVRKLSEPGFYADAATIALLSEITARRHETQMTVGRTIRSFGGASDQAVAQMCLSNAMANMALGNMPVLALLPATGDANFATPVSATGESVTLISPATELAAALSVSGTGFTPLALPRLAGGAPIAWLRMIPLLSTLLPFETLDGSFRKLLALGLLTGVPRNDFNWVEATAAGIAFNLQVTTALDGVWADAANGDTIALRRGNELLRAISETQQSVHQVEIGIIRGIRQRVTSTPAPTNTLPIGTTPSDVTVSAFENVGGSPRQVAPLDFTLVKAPFVVSPDTFQLRAERLAQFTAAVDYPPSSYRVSWAWGDGTTSEFVNSRSASHTYAQDGDYTVVATLLTNPARVPLAADTAHVRWADGPYWRITSITPPQSFIDQTDPGDAEETDLIYQLMAAPGAGLITIEANGNVQELRLRVRRDSVAWDTVQCCPPPPFSGALERLLPLGFSPPVPWAVGPYFAGWGSSNWSQTSTALDGGTINGQWIKLLFNYPIPNQGIQPGPASAFRFAATKNGNALTGTLSLHAWFIDQDTQQIETEVFPIAFTAVRLGGVAATRKP